MESFESIFLLFLFQTFYTILIYYFCFIYSGGPISVGSQRTFWGIGNHAAVSVVGLGDAKSDWDELEKIDGVKENVRIAVAGKHFLILQMSQLINLKNKKKKKKSNT